MAIINILMIFRQTYAVMVIMGNWNGDINEGEWR